MKLYSFSEKTRVEIVTVDDIDDDVDIIDIVDFFTCQYSDKWWLGCVLGVEGNEVKKKLLGTTWTFSILQIAPIS